MAIRVNLITGRSIQQGVSMEAGKGRPAYTAACGIIGRSGGFWELASATRTAVTSRHGSVIVKAVEATRSPPRCSVYTDGPGQTW